MLVSCIPNGTLFWTAMATEVDLVLSLAVVGQPWVRITAPGFYRYTQLVGPVDINIRFHTDLDQETLTVEQAHKSDMDSTTAVIVESVSFFGIQDPRFVWAGRYMPQYPLPWASEQTDLPLELEAHTYLGWNGTWSLTFGVPVFLWMHRIQNRGWIYQ